MRTIKVQYFFTVGEAAAFYVEHGGHGVITHTIGGKFNDCPPEREKDPAWLVEVFVNVTAQEIEEGGHVKPGSGFISGWRDSRDTDSAPDDTDPSSVTEEFTDALHAARSDGVEIGLSFAIQRWQNDELILPQLARLIDRANWKLPQRLSRAHEAFMRDWEGESYDGRHTKPTS